VCEPLKVKIASLLTLAAIACQSFPGVALGYDISERIEAFTKKQIKTSNNIIETRSGQIDRFVDQGLAKIENLTLNGLSALENLTGRNEQNSKAYKKAKTNFLEAVGLGLGLIEGSKDISLGLYSVLAKVPTAPERIVNFAIEYNRDSGKYHKQAATTLNAISDTAVLVAKDPLTAAGAVYLYGKDIYTEAKKDPLEYGKLGGKVAANVGFFLIGGTQIKALSSANKAEKAAKATSEVQKAGTSIFSANALKNFLGAETANLNLGYVANMKQVSNIKLGTNIKVMGEGLSDKLSRLVSGKVTVDDVIKAELEGKKLMPTKDALEVIAKMAGADLKKAKNIYIVRGKTAAERMPRDVVVDTNRRTLYISEKTFEHPADLAVTLGDEMKIFEKQLLIKKNKMVEAAKIDTLGAGLEAGQNFAAHFPPGYTLAHDDVTLIYKLFPEQELAALTRGY